VHVRGRGKRMDREEEGAKVAARGVHINRHSNALTDTNV